MAVLSRRFSLRSLLLIVFVCALAFAWFLAPTEQSRIDQLRGWLGDYERDILTFYREFQPIREEVELTDLEAWIFGHLDFDLEGATFTVLGTDGMGGKFVVWSRPDQEGPPALVYFGGSGEFDIAAPSVWDFPQVLAHGPDYAYLRKKEDLESGGRKKMNS